MRRILVVGGDASLRFAMRDFLVANDFAVDLAESVASAEDTFRAEAPDAVVVDGGPPDAEALTFVAKLARLDPEAPVVLVTGNAAVAGSRAIQHGAGHWLAKPVDLPALRRLLERSLELRRARRRHAATAAGGSRANLDPFVGTSRAIRALEQEVRRVLRTESTLLIQGEPGVGKGVLASWIHRNGPRRDEPYVEVRCAGRAPERLDAELFGQETVGGSPVPGRIEMAHHGMLFLDGVAELDLAAQGKILELVEDKRVRRRGAARARRVDVQLAAATHRDLLELARQKRFREDLYYRIGVIPLRVPSLRERPEDVPHLAAAILERLAEELGRPGLALSPEAAAALRAQRWPGNARELDNALERAALFAGSEEISPSHLEAGATGAPPPATGNDLALTLAQVERRHIERMLDAEGGHVGRAALRLGVPRSSLYQKVKQLGLVPRR